MNKVYNLLLYCVNEEDAYKQQLDLEIKQLEEEVCDHMKAYNDARIHVKFQIFEKSMDELQEIKQARTTNNKKIATTKETKLVLSNMKVFMKGNMGLYKKL